MKLTFLVFKIICLLFGLWHRLTSAFTIKFSRLPVIGSEFVTQVPFTVKFNRKHQHRHSTKIYSEVQGATEVPDFETLYLKDVFGKLSGGKQTVKFDSILKWSVVQQLIDKKVIDQAGLNRLFEQLGATTGQLVLNFAGFVQLVKLLDSTKSAAAAAKLSASTKTDSTTKNTQETKPRQLLPPSNSDDARMRGGVQAFDVSSMFGGGAFPADGRFIVSSFGDQDARIVQGPGGLGSIMDELMNIFSRSGRLSGGAFRPGASRTEIDVWKEFHRIARGRLSIGYEDLVNWTIVRSLLSNNQLTEAALQSIVQSRVGGDSTVQTRSGIDADCFERIVNDIVDAAGQTAE